MSLWDESRLGMGGGYRHALGVWDPRHKLASLAWMPPLSERRKLAGLVRYVYALNFTLDPSGVGNTRFTVTSDFWLTDAIGSIMAEEGTAQFTVQLFDTKAQVRYMNLPLLNRLGGSGTFTSPAIDDLQISPQLNAQRVNDLWNFPYYLRRIDKIRKGTNMLVKLQAQQSSTGTGEIQICLGGYIR